jgi:hypothetical protein
MTLPNISPAVWKTIRAVIAAACTFTLITQTQLELTPIVQYVLGLIIVVLAILESPAADA